MISRSIPSLPTAILPESIYWDEPQTFYDPKIVFGRNEKLDTIWNKDLDTFYLNMQLPSDTGYLVKNKVSFATTAGPYDLPVDLRLPYNQNYLSFNFAGSGLSAPGKTKYRYLLQGIDKHWSPVSEKPFSENYRDLPAGHYVFKLSSKTMNGIWTHPAELSFTILPPWWKNMVGIPGIRSFCACNFRILYPIQVKGIEERQSFTGRKNCKSHQ
jgi:hypothetical protein